MKTQDKKVLNEIYQGCEMGIDALNQIFPKINDGKLLSELNAHQKDLKELKEEICQYGSMHNEELEEESVWKEWMLKWMTKWNLLMDGTTSHIAEMLIQGGDMGVITARKLLNESNTLDKEVEALVKKFIRLEENNNEKMKEYL